MKANMDEIRAVIDEVLGQDERGRNAPLPFQNIDDPIHVGVKNILLLCSEYDHFILEEEGRLSSLLNSTYKRLEKSYVPIIRRVEDSGSLMSLVREEDVDLLVIFNVSGLDEVMDIAAGVRKEKRSVPIVYVGRKIGGMEPLFEGHADMPIDHVFTWSGDGEIFLDITMFIEDGMYRGAPGIGPEPKKILIMNKEPRFYSNILTQALGAAKEHLYNVIREDISSQQRLKRIADRAQVMIAKTADEAASIYRMYKDVILCGIVDCRDLKGSREASEDAPFPPWDIGDETPLIALTHLSEDEYGSDQMVIREGSSNYNTRIRNLLGDMMGPLELVLKGQDGTRIHTISDMRSLEEGLWSADAETLRSCVLDGGMGSWLRSRSEYELDGAFLELADAEFDPEALRKGLIDALERYKASVQKGSITRYSRTTYGPHIKFSRIGKGAMGGKAKGLAFMDKVISTYFHPGILPDMDISMPRTIVLCSDIFDAFLEENDLRDGDLYDLSDERIAVKFMESELPAILLGDLRAFIRDTKVPIVVRSSSLLEDALLHPFAGVYSSILLSNVSWEMDMRFHELCNAIKYVFASVFFQKARSYLETTPKTSEDEKMAVIIQELVGTRHGDVFYPTVSGVARSYDYYPSGTCSSKDGVVNLALGLGKAVVEGGSSFRFCPIHPKRPKYGTIKELLGQSQRDFFAVDLNTYVNIVKRDEDSGLVRLGLEKAEKDGSLDHIASTYDHVNDRLSPGMGGEGPRVVDFAPMLKMEVLPLADAVNLLLRVGESALGTPVEIEFAMNLDEGSKPMAVLYLLQVRPMVSGKNDIQVDIGVYKKGEILCRTDNILGNMISEDKKDIVYVRPDTFDMSESIRVVDQIRKVNSLLIKQKRPYILIGPGRWGSTDRWMGIPVAWSDIAGAGVIVETPVEERMIDPSQGSHFFHNMISAGTGYMTVGNGEGSELDMEWLDSLPAETETEYIRHVRSDVPLEVRLDGRSGKGVILRRKTAENDAKKTETGA